MKKIERILNRIVKIALCMVMMFSLTSYGITSASAAEPNFGRQAKVSMKKMTTIDDVWDTGAHAYKISLGDTTAFCMDIGKSMSNGIYMDRASSSVDTQVKKVLNWYYSSSSQNEFAFWTAQVLIWGLEENKISSAMDFDGKGFWDSDIVKNIENVCITLGVDYDGGKLGPMLQAIDNASSSGTYYVYEYTSGYQDVVSAYAGYVPVLSDDYVTSNKQNSVSDKVTLTVNKTDAQSSRALEGVAFDLYKDNANVTTVTTNSNGVASYTFEASYTKSASSTKKYVTNYSQLSPDNKAKIPSGYYTSESAAQAAADKEANDKAKALAEAELNVKHTYKAVETKTKTEYYLNPNTTTQSTSYASGDGSGTVTFSFTNTRQTGNIAITKTDSDTAKGVAGAVYGLYARENIVHPDGKTGTLYAKNSLVSTFPATGNDGKASLTGLYLGSYYVKEITAPTGYVLSSDIYNVDLTYAGQTQQVTSATTDVKDRIQKGSIEIVKKDRELANGKDASVFDSNNDEAQGDASIAGAVYGLYARENIVHPDGKTGVIYAAGTKVAEFPATDEHGKARLDNLYLGKYYVKEITESAGYLIDATEYDIDLAYAGQNQTVSLKSSAVYETVKKQAFDLFKVGQAEGSSEVIPLDNIEFTVKLESDVTRLGWDNAPVYDVITTDENGFGSSIELPYGYYRVKETKGQENYYTADDFFVTVSEDSRVHQNFSNNVIINREFSALIKIVKKDADTGKTAAVSGAEFKVKALTDVNVDGKKFRAGEYIYVDSWNLFDGFRKDTWTSNSEGYVYIDEKLGAGEYQIEEVKAPENFILNTEPVKFKVATSVMYETAPDGVTPVITVVKHDESVKGQISIYKEGEVLTGFEDGQFIYEKAYLPDMKVNIIADEDILDPADGSVLYAKDSAVETLVTDSNGKAVSSLLPLGRYRVEEVNAPENFILNTEPQYVSLEYKDQYTEIVYEDVTISNERQKFEISAVKLDAENDNPLANAEFTLTASEDIRNHNGDVIVTEGTVIALAVSDSEGKAVFDVDVPAGYNFDITETEQPLGYASTDDVRTVNTDYRGQDTETVYISETFRNKPTIVDISKQDITTDVEVAGNKLKVTDSEGNIIDEWTSEQGKVHTIKYLHVGETYTLTEELAATGYLKANDIQFTIADTGEVQTVVMKDELVKGQISIYKEGEVLTGFEDGQFIYEMKRLPGQVFRVYAEKDIVHPDGQTGVIYNKDELVSEVTTDENGLAAIPELYLGEYRVEEYSTTEGLVLNTEPQYVSLEYKDQYTEVVYEQVTFENQRQKIELDLHKADYDTSMPLGGNEFTIYANKAIKDYLGNIIAEEGTALSVAVSDENGLLDFDIELPSDTDSSVVRKGEEIDNAFTVRTDRDGNILIGDENSMFYIRETDPAEGYATLNAVIYIDTTYRGQDTERFTVSYDIYNELTTVIFDKKDMEISDLPVVGTQLAVFPLDEEGNILKGEAFDTWITQADNSETAEDESLHTVRGLDAGKYALVETLTEEARALGYVTADVLYFTVKDTNRTQYVTMYDDFTKVIISKKDSSTEDGIPDTEIALIPLDDNDNPLTGETFITELTDEDGQLKTVRVPVGRYIIREKSTNFELGYVTADDMIIEVMDTPEVQEFTMYDEHTKVLVNKVDEKGNYVAGQQLRIVPLDEEANPLMGEAFDTILTGDESVMIEYLPVGEYMLYELSSTDEYTKALPVRFAVEDKPEVQEVTMINKQVFFSKIDQLDLGVAGAHINILDYESGEVLHDFITDGNLVNISAGLETGKTYIARELSAPEHHDMSEDIIFTVEDDGMNQTVEMVDIRYDLVAVSKQDITTKEELPGAKMKISDLEGNILYEWISTDKPYYVWLAVGEKYLLTEVIAPKNYQIAETIEFEIDDNGDIVQKIEMYDELLPVKKVETGDKANAEIYILSAALSGMLIAVYAVRRRKENE